ncbi:EAL domain-containing protein [Leucobacter sp. CSA1]|uniref:EAL domain-containing protein n=1 Tax=Leucobacter chromiisoli TaxID=2796471 RepID=A0A934QBC2_9MICO|nr:EAL domain-containing protein [Leucobacter chromiisoli]MBK0420039.1 EAL domain-containing protein [Leucobacter chromiisoli]
MLIREDTTKRDLLFALPFAGLALGAIGYGAFEIVVSGPPSWTLVIALVAGVIICGPFQMRVGRHPESPLVGVTLVMLAIHPRDHSHLLDVCIWTFGVAISQAIARRDLLQTLYATGVSSAGAFAFVAIGLGLGGTTGWAALGLLVGTAAYYGLVVLVELARQRLRPASDRAFGVSAVSPSRIGLVVLIVAATAALMSSLDSTVIPWLEGDPRANRTRFLLLLTASVFYMLAQRQRYADTERRLSAIVDAAVELPRESGGGLAAALQDRAEAIVQADRVELRDEGPGRNEIGAEVAVEADSGRYVVASRRIGGAPFTREDERALATLAHVASEAARMQDEVHVLERRANSDALTGLPNYGAFQEALVDANENRPYHEGIALLFIDLDNFKKLNDTFGHRAGDELLRAIAGRLQSAAGGGGFVSRVGGDEFVVILSGLVSLEQAREAADRIVEAVSQPLELEGQDLRPAVSAGLAFSSHRELDAQALVEDADRAMLKVKRSRRDGAAEGSSVGISSHRSSRTNDIVARAIREGRLSLAFQPIVSLDEGRIWAFEALVRYVDPELGPISPPSLVARAKSLGLMNELTEQVVTKALDAAEKFRRLEPGIACITVNLELGQISDAELGPFIREASLAHPEISLCIELNERSLRAATDELRRDAEEMQAAGVTIALDDYGSEDSSVGALVHFPMDILKIDKSLINDLDDVRQREVLKALQGFGDKLGYTMVVEGIETPAMVGVMTEIGVRNAQGYHFGRPLSLPLTMDRIRRWGSRASID